MKTEYEKHFKSEHHYSINITKFCIITEQKIIKIVLERT